MTDKLDDAKRKLHCVTRGEEHLTQAQRDALADQLLAEAPPAPTDDHVAETDEKVEPDGWIVKWQQSNLPGLEGRWIDRVCIESIDCKRLVEIEREHRLGMTGCVREVSAVLPLWSKSPEQARAERDKEWIEAFGLEMPTIPGRGTEHMIKVLHSQLREKAAAKVAQARAEGYAAGVLAAAATLESEAQSRFANAETVEHEDDADEHRFVGKVIWNQADELRRLAQQPDTKGSV